MTTALEVRQPTAALAIRPGQEMWTPKQQAALAILGIKGASNADMAVFMHVCQTTGLDPFSRQIYGIMRREKQGDQWVDKFTIQTGIDGFRVIRDRVAARLGVTVEYEDTIWYDADGSAHTVWLWDHAPAACNVTVVKDGKRFPGVVRTASYAATNRNGDMVAQWRTQPDHMIEKCAEAFALRRAFPHDLGGVHLDDEMPAVEPVPNGHHNGRVTADEIHARHSAPPDASPAEQQPGRAAAEAAPTPPAQPAGEAPDDRPPAMATGGQVGMIQTELERLGYDLTSTDDQQAALRVMARLARVDDITAPNQLSQEKATEVRKVLKGCNDVAQLDRLLEDGEVPSNA